MAQIYDRRKAGDPRALSGSALRGPAGSAIPNSAMLSLLGSINGGGEAAATLRAQRPAAEAEADRLSAGVAATTPAQLKREMGQRLGADFSNVRFHTGAASVRRADRMGARAWTQGGDVYFGEGGFDPAVAAHELVHTVQQGAVAGNVGESAPAGTVQMLTNPFKWIHNKFKAWQLKRAKARQAAKRPWEMTEQDLQANQFNPGGVDELTAVQSEIDQAQSPAEAYRIFGRFAGNDKAEMMSDESGDEEQWNPQEVDMDRFRAKMKNMARMVHDYPELKGQIGNLWQTTEDGVSMSAGSTEGGSRKSELEYNATVDSRLDPKSVNGDYDRGIRAKTAAGPEFDGNHELGHVLNSLLFNSRTHRDRVNARRDWDVGITSDLLLKRVLGSSGILTKQQRKDMTPVQKDDPENHVLQGQVDLRASGLADKGITSWYGATNPTEFFAEAFKDVYANGAKARKASIELVKNYERLMKMKKSYGVYTPEMVWQ